MAELRTRNVMLATEDPEIGPMGGGRGKVRDNGQKTRVAVWATVVSLLILYFLLPHLLSSPSSDPPSPPQTVPPENKAPESKVKREIEIPQDITYGDFHLSSIPLPLGVGLKDLKEVARDEGSFVCRNGKGKMPIGFFNDHYCDCPDGSDEPGTSACLNGRFTCPNRFAGPTRSLPSLSPSLSVSSSKVNDGFCDCCDGSDEWAHPTLCTNTCAF